jgi:autotransporter-associated beta strand protein
VRSAARTRRSRKCRSSRQYQNNQHHKATTSLTKSGKGTWALSGTNSYTGPTTVKQGTLSLANARSLSDKTEVSLSEGAMLDLNFQGEMRISKLYFDGKLQPAGTYSAENAPKFIKGKGALKN